MEATLMPSLSQLTERQGHHCGEGGNAASAETDDMAPDGMPDWSHVDCFQSQIA